MIYTFSFLANLTPIDTHSQTGRWVYLWQRKHGCLLFKSNSRFLCPPVTQNAEDCPKIMEMEIPPWPTGITQDITLNLSKVEQVVSLGFI